MTPGRERIPFIKAEANGNDFLLVPAAAVAGDSGGPMFGRNAAGALKARLNNLDPEHSASIPMTAIALHGSRLTFTVASMNASYSGVVAADGKSGVTKKPVRC